MPQPPQFIESVVIDTQAPAQRLPTAHDTSPVAPPPSLSAGVSGTELIDPAASDFAPARGALADPLRPAFALRPAFGSRSPAALWSDVMSPPRSGSPSSIEPVQPAAAPASARTIHA
jgi:hypothetical protein